MFKKSINHQLIYLFMSNFTILFVGMGLFPLLPLYFTRFGASRAMIGVFFAAIYVANAAGPLTVGWLSNRLTRRGLFVTSGLIGIPALILLGQANDLWQVIALTSIIWYCGGVDLALVSIFTGLHTNVSNRGKSFSLISLSIPLGSLLGGVIIGYLLGSHGYAVMFAVLGIVWIILPILGLIAIKDEQAHSQASTPNPKNIVRGKLGGNFYLLLLVSLLSATAINIGRLGSSLSMQSLDFSAAAIASSATISGLVTIPITLLIGFLSDQLSRRHFLALNYVLAAAGAISLSLASELWHFWLVATITLITFCINGAMSSALAADLLPTSQLGRGLSWVNTVNSAGSILSFVCAGFLIDMLGAKTLFLLASSLPIAAAALVEIIPQKNSEQLPLTNTREVDCIGQTRSEVSKSALSTSGGCQ